MENENKKPVPAKTAAVNGLYQKTVKFISVHKKGIKLWAFALLIGALLFRGVIQQPQIKSNQERINELNNQIEYEKQRSEEVDNLKEMVGTDEYIEKIAREKLGLIKENEKVFVDVSKNSGDN